MQKFREVPTDITNEMLKSAIPVCQGNDCLEDELKFATRQVLFNFGFKRADEIGRWGGSTTCMTPYVMVANKRPEVMYVVLVRTSAIKYYDEDGNGVATYAAVIYGSDTDIFDYVELRVREWLGRYYGAEVD